MAVGPPERRLADVYTEYQRRLHEASAVDFDDLLVLAVRLFREHPEALERYRTRFQHVLVDEFQDTNAAQWELVRLLTEEHRSVMVVGDVDQSIYKFRGADFRNLSKFEEAFPEATIIVLDQNYRSTQRILDAANAVIAEQRGAPAEAPLDRAGRGRADRPLPRRRRARRSRRSSSREIHRLIDNADHRFGDIAVFYRTNAQSRVVEESLVRAGHPVPRVRRREVLRPARDQGRARVPPRAREPRRRSVVEAHRQHAEARRRRHVGREDRLRTRRARASRSAKRCAAAAAAGVTGKALGGMQRPARPAWTRSSRRGRRRCRRTRSKRCSTARGYLAELRAERSVEAQGRIENLQELVGVAQEFDDQVDPGDLSGLVAIGGVGHRRRDAPRRRPQRRRWRGCRRSSRRSRSSPISTPTIPTRARSR